MKEERRHHTRLGLRLPVRVSGFGSDGKLWTEMSTVRDASISGASFTLKHAIARGNVLHLLLPLPKRFRSYDLTEASYHVYALVRSVGTEAPGTRVGVLFLGKQPPRGFEKQPTSLYLLPNDPAPAKKSTERRVHQRLDMFVNLRLKRLDGDGTVEERTIAENIGRGGARVLSSMSVTPGDILLVQEVDGTFETRAEVCNVYVGQDNVPRLNLHFLDAQAPNRLVSTD